MTSWFDQPQSRFLLAAIVTLTLAAVVIKWAGKVLREQLGSGATRSPNEFRADLTANVPQTLVREAIEKGLVTPSQLAGMSDIERQFLFASLSAKLGTADPAPATLPPPTPAPATLPLPALLHPTDDAESARLAAALDREKPRLHCPTCGTQLTLPAFPPIVATCRTCGSRTAVRDDEGGRMILNVTPPKAQ